MPRRGAAVDTKESRLIFWAASRVLIPLTWLYLAGSWLEAGWKRAGNWL